MDILEFPYKSYGILLDHDSTVYFTIPSTSYNDQPDGRFVAVFFRYVNFNPSSSPPFWTPKILVAFDGNLPGPISTTEVVEVNCIGNPSKLIVPTNTQLVIYNGDPLIGAQVFINILVYRNA